MTLTQFNIAVRLANSQPPKVIADEMGLTVKNFQYHFTKLRKSLGIKIKGPAAYAPITVWAWRQGLVLIVLLTSTMRSTAQLPPVPSAIVVPNTNGACAYLAWDYPTNELSSIAGFEVGYGSNTDRMTNSAAWNQSSLVPLAGITNGLRTFTNRVCSLIATQTYYFAVRAYDIYGTNKSDWSNVAKWQRVLKTNRVITISVLTNSSVTGTWKPDARFNTITLTNPTGSGLYFKIGLTTTNT